MKRRASFELSAEMIVVLIISLVIVAMGTVLVKKMYSSGLEDVGQIDEQTQQELFNLLDRGERVVNPFNRKDTEDGVERGKMTLFALGVRNKLNAPETFDQNDFNPAASSNQLSGGNRFNVSVHSTLVPSGSTYTEEQVTGWVRMANMAPWIENLALNEEHLYIMNNDRHVYGIGVAIPRDAVAGTYSFSVEIAYVNSTHNTPANIDYTSYSRTEKLYIVLG